MGEAEEFEGVLRSGQTGKTKVTGWQRDVVIAVDKFFLGLAKHWVAVFTLMAFLYVGLPFLAPVLMKVGWYGAANVIYVVYRPLCHQLPFRSWYLFGDQLYYPRERAGLPVASFEQYAQADPYFDGLDVYTMDAYLVFPAKAFPGNEQMGFKVALCQRDVAIWGSIVLFGVAYSALRRVGIQVPKLTLLTYMLIALAPMGLDGGSQLLANPPFNGFGLPWLAIRESTPFLRTLTGAMFGIGNAWLAYPYIDESMRDTERQLTVTLRRGGVLPPAEAEATVGD
jgi:uncharacterized membrane protein